MNDELLTKSDEENQFVAAGEQEKTKGTGRAKCSIDRYRVEGFSPGAIYIGSGSSEVGLVEARGVEPLSEDLQHNGSTCLADRFSFAATHAHRLA